MSNNFHSGYSCICFRHCWAKCTHLATAVLSGRRKRPKCFWDSSGSCSPVGRPINQKRLLHCAWLCKCGLICLYQTTSQVSTATTMSPWLCEIFSHLAFPRRAQRQVLRQTLGPCPRKEKQTQQCCYVPEQNSSRQSSTIHPCTLYGEGFGSLSQSVLFGIFKYVNSKFI